MLEDAGRLDEAEPAFRRAIELDPKLDRAWYGLGLTLIRQQRYDEAVVALKRNTELQPMSPYGWYQLARVQLDRHEPDEGEIHHPHLFRRLDELGYAGFVGCEYRPRAGTSAGLGWLRRWREAQARKALA